MPSPTYFSWMNQPITWTFKVWMPFRKHSKSSREVLFLLHTINVLSPPLQTRCGSVAETKKLKSTRAPSTITNKKSSTACPTSYSWKKTHNSNFLEQLLFQHTKIKLLPYDFFLCSGNSGPNNNDEHRRVS